MPTISSHNIAAELDYSLPDVFRSEPGTTSVTIRLAIREDQLTENTEEFTLRIVPGEGQVVNPDLSEAVILIVDNDGKMS